LYETQKKYNKQKEQEKNGTGSHCKRRERSNKRGDLSLIWMFELLLLLFLRVAMRKPRREKLTEEKFSLH